MNVSISVSFEKMVQINERKSHVHLLESNVIYSKSKMKIKNEIRKVRRERIDIDNRNQEISRSE